MNVTSTQIQIVLSEVKNIENGSVKHPRNLFPLSRECVSAVKQDRSSFNEKKEMLQEMLKVIHKLTILSANRTKESNRRIQKAQAALG